LELQQERNQALRGKRRSKNGKNPENPRPGNLPQKANPPQKALPAEGNNSPKIPHSP
jgi:hypothetical protein